MASLPNITSKKHEPNTEVKPIVEEKTVLDDNEVEK
jgi:hypothetical protein